jgi:hypothetical protein
MVGRQDVGPEALGAAGLGQRVDGHGFGSDNAAWPSPEGAAVAGSEQGELAWVFDDASALVSNAPG